MKYLWIVILGVLLSGCGGSGADGGETSVAPSNSKISKFLSAVNQINHCGTTQNGRTNNSEEISTQVDEVMKAKRFLIIVKIVK